MTEGLTEVLDEAQRELPASRGEISEGEKDDNVN